MAERWSNAKVARIGFLLGQGYTTPAVAEMLDDGTSEGSIKRMRLHWELPTAGAEQAFDVRIPFDNQRRAKLCDQAAALGISPMEFMRRIMLCVVDDELYDAVNDGRFK